MIFLDLGIGRRQRELTGARAEMTAAAVGRAEIARAHLAGAFEDRMADRAVDRLAAFSAEDADLDVALRVHRVDQEAVAHHVGLDVPQVRHDDGPVRFGIRLQEFL